MKLTRLMSAMALGIFGLASAACAAGTHPTLGIVTFSTSDVNTNAMVESMTADAHAKGWKVEALSANGAPLQAITEMKELVTKRVNAIIVTVFDSHGLAAGIAAAKDAGIPVLSAGGGLAPGVAMAVSTGAAKPMIDLLLKNSGGRGTMLDLTYHPGIPCRERADAFDAAVKAHPAIKATSHEITIPGAAAASEAATSAWLSTITKSHGPFAIFNCYDDNAMGAIAALKQNDRHDVQVYSFNATPPALQAVQNGSMTATLWIDLKSGGNILVDAVPDILKQGAAWKPKVVIPANVVVTKANVEAFMKAHPLGQ